MSKTVYLSVGSNLGNKIYNCCKGIDKIEESGNSFIVRKSRFYLTSPTNYLAQNWFVNSIVEIKTFLSPYALLKELILIQKKFGRKSSMIRFGPRMLDLDIILYENEIINLPDLQIPHPRMHKRLFVIKPICELDPYLVHPILSVSLQWILKNIYDRFQKIIPICE